MRKNIYIRDEDEKLFDQAEKLAGKEGGLSGVIAIALRDYVATREAGAVGAQVRDVQPGEWGVEQRLEQAIKFRGTLLVRKIYPGPGGNADQRYELYLTQAGQVVAVWSSDAWENEDGECVEKVAVDVFADLESVTRVNHGDIIVGGAENGEVAVPLEVWEMAKASLGELPPRWID